MGKKRILIVEDEAIIAMNIKSILLSTGYDVAGIVSKGEDAVARVDTVSPDLILMDIILSGAMDGITAYEKIKESHRTPVIYLTAHSDDETISRAKATEPQGFIIKPINHNELHTAIEIALYKNEINNKLLDSEARYRNLFDNSKNCVAIYRAMNDGSDFIFVDFNRAAGNAENVRRKDIIDRSVLDVFPGVRDFGLLDVFQRVWRTGKPESHPVSLYRDSRISGWRDNYVYKLPSGEIVAIYNDETENKQTEENYLARLKRQEELLKFFMGRAAGPVLFMTPDLETRWASQDAEELLGAGAENISSSIPAVVDKIREYQRKKSKGDSVENVMSIKLVHTRNDGTVITGEIIITVLMDHDDLIEGFFIKPYLH